MLNRNTIFSNDAGRDPPKRAETAPGAVLAWVSAMPHTDRIDLARQLRGGARELHTNSLFEQRVDREESALTVALFLTFADRHNLTPVEASSLLDRASATVPQTLDLLGLTTPPTLVPGRNATPHPDRSPNTKQQPCPPRSWSRI